MIVQARTSKTLSWNGRLGVLSLTALVLPLVPTWAQRPDTPLAKAVRPDQEQLQDEIAQAFKHDPDVVSLTTQIKATIEMLQHRNNGMVRDPVRIAAQRRLDNLTREYIELWRTKSEEIRQRLIGEQSSRVERRLRDLEDKVDRLLKEM